MRIQWNQFTGCWSEIQHVLLIMVEGTRYRHTVIGTVWFRCPKEFKSKFIQYIIIINYYYSLVGACCYYEMRVTQGLTADIHTVNRTVWFYCPKKFKSKFIQYIIIINYYYSLVDACCYYEMRVTQELTTDIHTVTRTVWFCCPKKFKSKFIHYIIIKNYYYSLVDACCHYEMRVTS